MAEPFLTTVVGSMPKPPWLYSQVSFDSHETDHHGQGGDWALQYPELGQAQDDATRLIIQDQERVGIDIISDGEQRRKSYMTYVTTRLEGMDYETLGEKWIRDGRRLAVVGRCTGPVRRNGPILVDHLRFLMGQTSLPVRITLPGPMTVADSVLDTFYGDEREFALAIANTINEEARALDLLGPAVIQFDEPVFSRYPEKVVDLLPRNCMTESSIS